MVRILIKNYMIIFSVALSISTAQEDRPTAAILYFTGDGLTPQQTKSLGDHFSTELDSTENVSVIAQSMLDSLLEREGLVYFTGDGLTTEEIKSLGNHFSTALDSTRKISVIAQVKVDSLLEMRGLDVSDCTSDTCAISIGSDLGVSYVIAGNVIKMDDSTYTIAAKMLTVEAQTKKREESITYSGTLDGLNVQAEILVWKLLNLEEPLAKVGDVYGDVPGKGLWGLLKGLPTWMINVNPYWCGLGLVAVGGGVAIMIGGSDGGSGGSNPLGEPPDFPQAP